MTQRLVFGQASLARYRLPEPEYHEIWLRHHRANDGDCVECGHRDDQHRIAGCVGQDALCPCNRFNADPEAFA